MGWDADDLVDSQEAAEERREARMQDESLVNMTQEGRAREARIASLRLSHTRVTNQLAGATNAAHRQMLEGALESLDAQMKEAE